MREFSGKAGTVYVQRAKDVEGVEYEVWFEDFCILGTGSTKLEALEDASRHTVDILELILQAKGEIASSTHHEAGAGGG